ncbi:cyclic nucleotide-binding domain-containing protein [Alkalinema sp. FACHB-956]|uniref:cyclic nucleotide-binding domain-containing protein n=1 Tax=Alkalinema sp. FACHB-956 TaxID=2692768 RepID=UPI0016865EEB|nr:cyclic nucleotide-binding domain-containing protein [Alkalinema sp. FACHB-956]MBD2329098.1 cyclic nucleotide-binding domain-containing protein [Alkalinema sp. FACHB-956]
MTDILLQTLSSQDIHWLQTVGQPHQLQAHDILSDRESFQDNAYVLLEGKLALYATTIEQNTIEHSARTQSTQPLTQLASGELLGFLSAQDSGYRPITLQALDRASLLAIPQAKLQQKLQDDPSFAAHLYQAQARLLARRLNRLKKQLNTPAALANQPQRESVTIFSILEDSDLDWLITVGTVQLLPANTNLIQKAQPIDALHILLDGTLALGLSTDSRSSLLTAFSLLSTVDSTDRFTEFARLSRGDFIGETALVNAYPSDLTVRALRESKVLSIPRWRLSAKLHHDVEFASRFYHMLTIILTHQQTILLQHLGHGNSLDESDPAPDGEFLNKVALAEARFDWMLKRIQTELGTGKEIQW